MIHFRKERSDVVFRQVAPDHGESNRGQRLVGFAPCAPKCDLTVATVALGAFAEAKNAARERAPGLLEEFSVVTLQPGDPRSGDGDGLKRELKCEEG